MIEHTLQDRYLNLENTKMGASVYGLVIAAAILVSAICTTAIIIDLSQIHIFRHDSVYYLNHYLYKLKGEGRWLNYLFFPYLKMIPGQIAVYLNVLLFFSFCYIAFNKWTKNIVYSFLLALLFIQFYPLYSQVLWPATLLPSLAILVVAALLAPRLPLFVFYSLFGLLFLGTLSIFYYLLPLLHINLLDTPSLKNNIRIVLIKIIPAWALGFIFGYLVASTIIYFLTGQYGIEIDAWRSPHYIHNIHDLISNSHRSLLSLTTHTREILSGYWRPVAFVAALLVGLAGSYRHQSVPLILLSVAIVVSHYVITLPVGIDIHERTVIANWVGIFCCALLIPSIERWQQILVLPIITLLTVSFYLHNHRSLQWYTTVTNTYYDELLAASPLPPHQYSGVIMLGNDDGITKVNRGLESKHQLKKGAQEHLDNNYRWMPAAHEAGFRDVILCVNKQSSGCDRQISRSIEPPTSGKSGLYRVIGESNDGYLIITFNSDQPGNTVQ